MPTVAELMTQAVLLLSPETPLRSAAETLGNLGVSGAPVCDKSGAVVGVFSKSDVVDRLQGGRLDEAGTVGDHMTRKVLVVAPGDPVARAVSIMAREGVHRLIVADDAGHVLGIITPLDVVKALDRGAL
jgi:predicted transcriptional regulator